MACPLLTPIHTSIPSFIYSIPSFHPVPGGKQSLPESVLHMGHPLPHPSPLPVALSTILERAYAVGQASHSTLVQKVVANRPREAQKVTWPGMAGWEAAGNHPEGKFCPVFWKGPTHPFKGAEAPT